uniref:DOMON domain-containing protein n=1 Tax=Angiostrongylus cantonensis TaxID=6313 RepID=A0A0K0CZM3_ANGCA
MFVNLKTIMMTMAITVILTEGELLMNRDGCGKTKACLFKPVGCNPNLDCTIGLIFFVVGPNQLRIEMVATSLIPSVQQQYVAIGYVKISCLHCSQFNLGSSAFQGDDFVTECVMSNMGEFSGSEPEVFVSYNHGKSNDRIFLNDHEHRTLISNISSHVIDGRLVCHFTQQIIPQIDRKNGLIGDLDKDFFIMGATGSAQPDGLRTFSDHGVHVVILLARFLQVASYIIVDLLEMYVTV